MKKVVNKYFSESLGGKDDNGLWLVDKMDFGGLKIFNSYLPSEF
jgi:hypothetical protein